MVVVVVVPLSVWQGCAKGSTANKDLGVVLLALCPPNIDPARLNVMVAFAVGGLLGDTLFHLLPEIFLGETPEGEVRAVLVEPNKNLLLGVSIMVGFVTFVAM